MCSLFIVVKKRLGSVRTELQTFSDFSLSILCVSPSFKSTQIFAESVKADCNDTIHTQL